MGMVRVDQYWDGKASGGGMVAPDLCLTRTRVLIGMGEAR